MCDIVRTVPGVYGERMLGGGDKGASGALVAADSVDAVRAGRRSGLSPQPPGLRRAATRSTCARSSTAWRCLTGCYSFPGSCVAARATDSMAIAATAEP